jgi:hypothetical protein
MPVGVYVVKGDQVRWVPAMDVTVVVGSIWVTWPRGSRGGRQLPDSLAGEAGTTCLRRMRKGKCDLRWSDLIP